MNCLHVGELEEYAPLNISAQGTIPQRTLRLADVFTELSNLLKSCKVAFSKTSCVVVDHLLFCK